MPALAEIGLDDARVAQHAAASPEVSSWPCAITITGRHRLHHEVHVVLDDQERDAAAGSAPTMRSTIGSSSAGLTPAPGSSSSTSFGSATITRASSSNLRWPPDSTRAGSSCERRRGRRSRASARAALARAALLARGHRGRPQPVGPEALAKLARRRKHHVLQHAHLRKRPRDLERAREPGGEDRRRRRAADRHAIEARRRRRSAR